MPSNQDRRVMTLGALAAQVGIEPRRIKRAVGTWRKVRPEVPFPEPVRRLKYFDEYDADALLAWADEVAPNKRCYFNRIARRFICGEFDRPALQRQYQLKKIAAKPSEAMGQGDAA